MLLLLIFLAVNVVFSHMLAKRHYRVAAIAHMIFFFVFSAVLLFSGWFPGFRLVLGNLVGDNVVDAIQEIVVADHGVTAPISIALFAIFLQTLAVLTKVTTTSIFRIIRIGKKIYTEYRKKTIVRPPAAAPVRRPRAKLCYFLCVMRC